MSGCGLRTSRPCDPQLPLLVPHGSGWLPISSSRLTQVSWTGRKQKEESFLYTHQDGVSWTPTHNSNSCAQCLPKLEGGTIYSLHC